MADAFLECGDTWILMLRKMRVSGRGSKSGFMLNEVDRRREPSDGDEGPASGFRDAVTDGAGVWGPILGGVVAVGGGIALVGTLLSDNNGFDPNLACPSGVGADSCAPSYSAPGPTAHA